jgi:uncharacterized protein (DUF58 family)
MIGAIAALFAAAGAIAALEPLAFGALVLGIALTVFDFIIGPPVGQLLVQRIEQRHFALRVANALRYRITNRSTRALRVAIVEEPAQALQYLVDELRATVPPQTSVEVERPVLPLSRGEVALGNLSVWYESPLGLIRRYPRFAAQSSVRVYPDLSAVERYGTLRSRNRLIEAGLRKMRLRGAGTEFESLREWSSGDAFRGIDWKATARRGKLMVAQHEVERSQNIMLLLDCGRLMTPRLDEQRKLDYAVTAALSIATIAGLASDKIGFVAFANQLLFTAAPRPSKVALAQTAERLYGLEPRFEESDYGRAFSYVRSHLHKRSLVILFTDMFDPVASASVLSEIRVLAQRHLVLCVFMNDAAIENALATPPLMAQDVYRAGVAATLLEERRSARVLLEKLGVRVLDAPAKKLSMALIDAYLDIKARALL